MGTRERVARPKIVNLREQERTMLRSLVEDVEHVIYHHLTLQDCKSLFFVSKPAYRIAHQHLLTRKESAFQHYSEQWLNYLIHMNCLLETVRELNLSDLPLYADKTHRTLRTFLLVIRLTTETTPKPSTITLLLLLLREPDLIPKFALAARLKPLDPTQANDSPTPTITFLFQTFAEQDLSALDKLQKRFSYATPEARSTYLEVINVFYGLKHPFQKGILVSLIPYLDTTEQTNSLNKLIHQKILATNGATLRAHIENISKPIIAILPPSEPIIEYMTFIWKCITELEETNSYNVEEERQFANNTALENFLIYFPRSTQQELFNHYITKMVDRPSKEYKFLRIAIHRASLLAPHLTKDHQLQFLSAMKNIESTPAGQIAIDSLMNGYVALITHPKSLIRSRAFNIYMSKQPKKPTRNISRVYFDSLKEITNHSGYLSMGERQRVLDRVLSYPDSTINDSCDHSLALINLSYHHPHALLKAYQLWNKNIDQLSNQHYSEKTVDINTDNMLSLKMQLEKLAPLLSPNRKEHILDKLLGLINQPPAASQLLGILNLEALAPHVPDQSSRIIEGLWNLSISESDDCLVKQAIASLNNLLFSLNSIPIQNKIVALTANHPDFQANNKVTSSFSNPHSIFFNLHHSSTKEVLSDAHPSLNYHT